MKGAQTMRPQLSEAEGMQDSSSPRKGRGRISLIWLSISSSGLLQIKLTSWVGRCFDRVEKFHGLDVVEIYLMLEHDD